MIALLSSVSPNESLNLRGVLRTADTTAHLFFSSEYHVSLTISLALYRSRDPGCLSTSATDCNSCAHPASQQVSAATWPLLFLDPRIRIVAREPSSVTPFLTIGPALRSHHLASQRFGDPLSITVFIALVNGMSSCLVHSLWSSSGFLALRSIYRPACSLHRAS